MKPVSLRARLVKTLLLQMMLALALAGGLAVVFIWREVDEVYDATLVQFARSLSSMPIAELTVDHLPHVEDAGGVKIIHSYERKISYRVIKQGRLIAQSPDELDMGSLTPEHGFRDLNYDKKGRHEWRLYSFIEDDGRLIIQVAEKFDIRRELTYQLLTSLLVPGILFILGALAAIWWSTAFGLRQVTGISVQLDARAVDDLSPVDNQNVPIEIRPLTQALNDLFARIEQSFAREREFTDNAAHELRTPLAAIKTQAQALLRSENLTETGRDGLSNLIAGVDRAAEMTDALLSFARLQNDRSPMASVVLADIVQEEVRGLTLVAKARSIKIEVAVDIAAQGSIPGVRHALALMVRNIIHNAIKFSPENAVVHVLLQQSGDALVLCVRDTGPGIALEHRSKIFDRFYRIHKSQSGTGLGLSIVKWVADLHGAKIDLHTPAHGGLVFSVVFDRL